MESSAGGGESELESGRAIYGVDYIGWSFCFMF